MEWSREWQKETALNLSPDTVYEKKYFDQGGVARITMSRTNPKGLNLITPVGIRELIYCMRDARNDASIGAVIIRGAGDKSFNAGGDVGGEKEDSQQVFEDEPSVHAHMRLLGKPIIAVVKGFCIGMGNHLAYHCDFTLAGENAVFGQVGPRVGSPAGGKIVAYLAHVVGVKKARELWMLCRKYNAQEALQMGLINAVFPVDKVDEESEKWAEELLGMNPTCLRIVRTSFDDEIENMPHNEAYFANLISMKFFGGPEQLEAMNAFLEKRKPDWGKALRGKPADFK
ncbi:MAG TPA: enoyl-CoA hydratase-related protein [Syntrophorhabdaceae bacterium]|nr:enoyl-CoA hydratase-related protein [Syntrophorhabdaceae bacterium]